MDLTTMITPGAQSLATAIMTDSWAQVRTALSHLWARRAKENAAVDDSAALEPALLEQANQELELARQQAVDLAGKGTEADRAVRMELFWAGYLAGQIAARPELAEVVGSLPALLSAAPPRAATHNTVVGTVLQGKIVQTGDVTGNITLS